MPGSMTSDVLNLTRTSNVDIPGKWIFRIDDTSVEGGGCNVGGNTVQTLCTFVLSKQIMRMKRSGCKTFLRCAQPFLNGFNKL